MQVTLLNLFDRHGGAETCVRSLFEGLKRHGHAPRLVVGRAGVNRSDWAPDVSMLPRFLPEFLLQRCLSRLAGLTDSILLLPLWHAWRNPDLIEADVVHGHVLNGSYFNLWAIPILTRSTPVIVTLHDMWLLTGDCDHSEGCSRWEKKCGACPMMRRPRGLRNSVGWADLTRLNLAIKRAVFRRIPQHRLVVASPSRWMAEMAARSHLGRFRIEVVPNGLDLDRFAPGNQDHARQALGLPGTDHLFLAVAGSWKNPHKGGDLLLGLASGLASMGHGKLVVAGQLSTSLARSLQEAGAIMIGKLQDPAALCQLYNACDATLLLSRNENFPYVVSEALACGCPVIARAIGGVPEMVDSGVSGVLLPPSAAIEHFLQAARTIAHLSRERAAAMRAAARHQAVQMFDLSRMLNGYEKLYHQLIAPNQHSRAQMAA